MTDPVPPTDVEREAVRLRWLKLNPSASADDLIPPEESIRLLAEVRERAATIERSAYDMLLRATRNPPTRGGHYSKHMQWFWFRVLMPLIVIYILGNTIGAIANCGSNRSQSTGARSRDELVIEKVLLHFLSDRSEDIWDLGSDRNLVLLHPQNPQMIGGISKDQLQYDISPRTISNELLGALTVRNDANRDYHTKTVDYSRYRLDPRIKIVDTEVFASQHGFRLPKQGPLSQWTKRAKGWFKLYAPAFSADGTQAVVRGYVGPAPHGGSATYLLKRRGATWQVVWYEYAYYA